MNVFDGTAMALSGLCLIHCIALPIAFLALPSLILISELPESIHRWLVAIALPLATIALSIGYQRHRQTLPLVLGFAGLVFLSSAFVPVSFPHFETFMTGIGGTLLAIAHLKNWRMRRAIG